MAVVSPAPAAFDVGGLGQVFTPPAIVEAMLALVRNRGRVLEPACGDGAFLQHFPFSLGIEIDAQHAPPGARVMDFFALPEKRNFRDDHRQSALRALSGYCRRTRALNEASVLDGRANLYLFFIEKCLRHLAPGGELVFITPRDFLKATSAVPLNRLLYAAGTITDFVDLGDSRLFADATPNCAIWRFERDNFSRSTRYAAQGVADGLAGLGRLQWEDRHFVESGGHLLFTRGDYGLHLTDIAFVKVGAVSGPTICMPARPTAIAASSVRQR
jgi:adenine-specific DNA-methyltransferase